ncbi:MAG TPA: DnaJ domain-containing protein [Waterburya sp.]|jgi:curved DNA-binding protein CbpA
MSFPIERGLFKFDFTDHHAILGIAVDADVKEVRKRYLKIARRLHPDSCKAASEAEKKLASQLLSKLVNPAYEQLSQSNNRDYLVSLGHMGRRLASEGAKVPLASEAAKQLFRSGANLDNAYKTLVQKLASPQYDDLNQVVDKIAEISELNMVYLMLRKGEGIKTSSGTPTTKTGATGAKTPGTAPGGGRPAGTATTGARPTAGTTAGKASIGQAGPLPDSGLSRAAEYIRRAEGYITKNNFAAAVLELREALKLDPNNSRCHSLLGAAYLKQNQATMAKVHINKALQMNPQDELALKGKRHLDTLAQKAGGTNPKGSTAPTQGKQPDNKSGGGGLFGGLFGGKKK